ncbi:MAG TPA: polyphosphate kinase 2 family protein [Stellaceae bacterium]|jgi:PPK2 family polyphosphate:nucleotide phosphotransferase|nr:polyphosphate kinase 2 family protein [Stellaceae bacterium]
MKLAKILKACRVDKPEHFRLADYDPAETFGLSTNIEDVKLILADGVARLGEMQQRLYANGRWAVLVALQGMDAAGKDGVIKHVMSGINPQGCEVHAFKAPSAEELAHDFLWRTVRALPQRGHIGIFNRSHYEEVLVVRVHPEMLARQKLPPNVTDGRIWEQRFKDIRGFERHLARNGTRVLKFHLRISKEEQRKRFLARLNEPVKRWKFSMADVTERQRWDDYMAAYEDMIRGTSTNDAPWYVVPADHKHVAWVVVSAAIVEALEELKPEYPKIEGQALEALKAAEQALKAEKPGRADKAKRKK